jgi:hypothetical protein
LCPLGTAFSLVFLVELDCNILLQAGRSACPRAARLTFVGINDA